MQHWWQAPEWGKDKPMTFPERDLSKSEVIVLTPERKAGDKEQPPNDRVRVFTGR